MIKLAHRARTLLKRMVCDSIIPSSSVFTIAQCCVRWNWNMLYLQSTYRYGGSIVDLLLERDFEDGLPAKG